MGLNKAAKRQIREGKRDRASIQRKIDNFSYADPQFREGLSNPFAGVTNPFESLSNPFASARVATQAADFQRQANQESLANILDATVQSGGTSGASATALAQQAFKANQQISAGLEGQETRIQQQTAQGEAQRQQLIAQGEQRRQQLIGQGEQYITGLAENRAGAELQGLGAAYAGAQQTINTGYQSIAQTNAAVVGAVGQAIGTAGGIIAASDHRLKENIEFKRFSPSGVGVYEFNYLGHQDKKFEGALSIAVPEEARIKNFHKGFDGVDYSKIDVDLKRIK